MQHVEDRPDDVNIPASCRGARDAGESPCEAGFQRSEDERALALKLLLLGPGVRK